MIELLDYQKCMLRRPQRVLMVNWAGRWAGKTVLVALLMERRKREATDRTALTIAIKRMRW